MSVSRNADGQVTITRHGVTTSDIPFTATATRIAPNAWDFVAIDVMGRWVAGDVVRSYGDVLKAFEIVGL